jgi:acetolactate synthase-1/2/3 large subunit
MHLNDSIGASDRLQYICNHHEQACAMAAEGYARITGRVGVINVTTGPGGLNALTGVFGAWTDSVPMLVISGQVKRETAMASYPGLRLRQLGFQETDIVPMVRRMTKYAATVLDPNEIGYHLDRALWLAENGRPGPVWIDIPVDVQGAKVDPAELRRYDPVWERATATDLPDCSPERIARIYGQLNELVGKAKRPVVLAGNGIRQGGAAEALRRLTERLGIPVVCSRSAPDLIPVSHAAHCGRSSVDSGTRAGNFAIQNADLLVVLGCRLQVVQTGYNFAAFARNAAVVQVDIDAAELDKPTFRPHLGIHCDARPLVEHWLERVGDGPAGQWDGWLAWCRERVAKYPPVVRPRMEDPERPLNPYLFLERLFELAPRDAVFACANGSAFAISSQVARLEASQRLFFNAGCASMGHGLPAAIGASFALGPGGTNGGPVICLEGDGSIQMNIQELATVAHYRLPLKIFVINNGGYLSMRVTQGNLFGRFVGEGASTGVSIPDCAALAGVYGIASRRLDKTNYREGLAEVLAAAGPVLAEVMVDPAQPFEPRLMARRRADGGIESPDPEDMWPHLSAEELAENRIADGPAADLLRLAEALREAPAMDREPVAE